ncbi:MULTISPECIES: helix-hairpin-helix domain-containing protein [Sulfurimonas]|uniref:Helix-hairpin-helix domain-containing protein n=1 Tax=Sulfurimonas diazotrophicus TaxID=3131939 RepID=A0ABZ3H747_9BACT
MHPDKVKRETTRTLTDLPNIGPSLAGDLRRIGINRPEQLVGQDPVELYGILCELTGSEQDPCVLDVFMSITDFMNGGEAKVWWAYTPQRKAMQQRD